MNISAPQSLRQLYAMPQERAVKKQMGALDVHCRRFIEMSLFLVVATLPTRPACTLRPRRRKKWPGVIRPTCSAPDFTARRSRQAS